MDKTVAIAVPIYAPHISYGSKLLQTRKDTDNEHIRIVFGCSCKAEMDALQLVVLQQCYHNVELIVISCEHVGNKAIYKKNVLLRSLKERFDFVCCFDAETEFVRHIPPIVLADAGIKPTVLGSRIASVVNRQCLSNFEHASEDWQDVYFWFSDVPVYCSLYLHEFYKEFSDLEALCENYENFEYIMYIYYLKLRLGLADVNIVDIGETYGVYNGWSLEDCSATVLEALHERGCNMPLWCSPAAYAELTGAVKDGIYLVYHTDRAGS